MKVMSKKDDEKEWCIRKDDDIWSLKGDEYSLEFTFDRSIRMERFL